MTKPISRFVFEIFSFL